MSFDRIAPVYGWMERLLAGNCMHRARNWLLEGGHVPRKVLMVGEGHGRFLKEFRRHYPAAEITVVDGSAGMIRLARASLNDHRGVTFVHSLIQDWQTEQQFDLVVTNFLLDCLPEAVMESAIERLSSWTSPAAQWWLADFDIPEHPVAKWRSRLIVRLLYLFFGIVAGVEARKLHPPDQALEQAGFLLVERKTWSWGLLKSERWSRGGG